MRKRTLIGTIAAAGFMMLSTFGPAAADTAPVSLTITPGDTLSVTITDSNDFPDQAFSLTSAPGNYTYSAHYDLEVVDSRGTGQGWNVTASASPFEQEGTGTLVPGSGLPSANNHCPGNYAVEFCSTAGSISTGVSVVAGSPDLIAGSASIFAGAAGQAAGPVPNATGTFTTQEAVYYTGFPVAIQAGTYTTTVTLSISSQIP